MTLGKRIGKVLGALAYLLCVFLLYRMGEDGFKLVCMLMSLSLILFGVRNLLFYFTMARHMVDGRGSLYIGVIVLDFGVFTLSVSQNQSLFIVFYLLARAGGPSAQGPLLALQSGGGDREHRHRGCHRGFRAGAGEYAGRRRDLRPRSGVLGAAESDFRLSKNRHRVYPVREPDHLTPRTIHSPL